MVSFPGGLTRSRTIGGRTAGQLNAYPIRNGVNVAMYSGDPVRVSSTGVLTLGINTAAVIGVARQFAWIDKTTGQPQYSNYIPANTSTHSASAPLEGYSQPFALVDDDPRGTWIINTDTSVSAGRLTSLCGVTNAGTQVGTTGRSAAEADVHDADTSVSAGNAMFRIIGVYRTSEITSAGAVDNNFDQDPGTLVEVVFQNHLYG